MSVFAILLEDLKLFDFVRKSGPKYSEDKAFEKLYGGEDKNPWVSPYDIAAAIAEEFTTPFMERKFRYVASEELTCNEMAKMIGDAIGKPYLKWFLISDKEMFDALKSFKLSDDRAKGVVEMQAGSHTGSINEDFYRNKPVFGKVKFKDYVKDFAVVYNQK